MSEPDPFGTKVPEGFSEPSLVRRAHGGMQAIWRFDNGRGASVVRHKTSHGTEFSVLRITGDGEVDYDPDYEVIPNVPNSGELLALLRQVEDLPAPGAEDVGDPDGSGQSLPNEGRSWRDELGSLGILWEINVRPV